MKSRDEIREFVCALLAGKGVETDFDDSYNLMINGLLDSMDVLRIVLFLEERYGIQFELEMFDREHFDSIDGIASLISTLTTQTPASPSRE